MPLYEYRCEACAHRFERIQKFSDPPVETCPQCSGQVKKLLSAPAIQFKGSGFYITDYGKSGAGESKSEKADKAGAKAESASSDSKSESKSDTKSDTKSETKSESKTETKAPTKAETKPAPIKTD